MSDAEDVAVDMLTDLLTTAVKQEGLPTPRGGRAGPVLYPASLEYAQGISAGDNDVLTTKERYFLHDSKKLVVGKYVPDPKLLVKNLEQPTLSDFIPNKKEGSSSRQGSASLPPPTAGGSPSQQNSDDVPKQQQQHPPRPPPQPRPMGQESTPTRGRTVVSSTFDDPDDRNWEDVPNDDSVPKPATEQQSSNESGSHNNANGEVSSAKEKQLQMLEQLTMQMVTRRGSNHDKDGKKVKTLTKYRLVQPLFPPPISAGVLFFPIYYPNKPTTKERTDPRGIAKDINNAMHGEYTMPLCGSVISQVDNLNKMGLYKIGPGAVAFKCVINAFEVAGLKYTPGTDWNVMWAKRATPEILANMGPYQRINHFIGAWGIGRKDNLHKNVNIMKKQFGKAFDIVPGTFVIPSERRELEKDFETWTKSVGKPGFVPTYICKPVASSCGKGIHLVQGLPPNPKAANKSLLVQRYIGNPMLIEGRKFDLRIYVAATSFDPLRVYIFDEGLVRFAAEKYPGPDVDLENTHMHLTNYSVNKTAQLAKESAGKDIEDDDGPVEIKWLLSEFKTYVIEKTGAKTKQEGLARWAHIESQMHDIIIKAMLVVEMDVITQMRAHSRDGTGRESFELYGFDMIVDENYRLDLLEVNIMPSLATGFSIDKAVKQRLLAHLLTMVGVMPYDRRRVRLEDGGNTPEEDVEERSRNQARDHLLMMSSNAASGTRGPGSGKIFSAASGSKCDLRYHYTLPKGHGGRASSRNHSAISADFIDEPLLTTLGTSAQRAPPRVGSKRPPGPDISASELAMLIESDEELHRAGGWNRIFPIPNNGEASKRKYFHLFRCGVLRSNYLLCSWEAMKGKLHAAQAEKEGVFQSSQPNSVGVGTDHLSGSEEDDEYDDAPAPAVG